MPLLPGRSWRRAIAQLLTLYFTAVTLGWVINRLWLTLAIVSMGVVAWQYGRLWRLQKRLAEDTQPTRALGHSVWAEVEGQLQHRQHDERNSKRRLLDMLRTYRTAAAVLPDAVVIIDRDSQRVVWFNEASERLLGLRYPRDMDLPIADLLKPLPVAAWMTADPHTEQMVDALAA